MCYYFNTSHVNVNPRAPTVSQNVIQNFNTSHVNVNQKAMGGCRGQETISIHLMLMLISLTNGEGFIFQMISIHLMLMLIQVISF